LATDRLSLELKLEQLGWRTTRSFQLHLLASWLPTCLSKFKAQPCGPAFLPGHVETRRGQGDQQCRPGCTSGDIKLSTRHADQPRDANLLVLKLHLLVIFAIRPWFAVEATT
jgi:hypothetical protein